jgi:hypothetical protein
VLSPDNLNFNLDKDKDELKIFYLDEDKDNLTILLSRYR